jgi:putative DNA primase/helicase
MANDFSSTGAFNVNGQWATGVRYEAAVEQGRVVDVHLRFTNGRSELASAKVTADEARDLLGEKNYGVILKATANAAAPGKDQPGEPVKGELRGKALEFRQVTLADYQASQNENAIHLDSRVRSAPAVPADATASPDERLTARDVVVGGAHVVQAAGVGGATVQTAAKVVGAADAAKVAVDVAQGKEVRPLDAATAAASVVATTGVGGAGVVDAARAVQAVGAAETGLRAMRSADDVAARAMGEKPTDQPNAVETEEALRLRRMRAASVPDAVADRFLKVEDKYYFPDKTLAFTDKGTKLKAESNNVEVVRSLVSIAEARDWQALSVTGTKEFRKEVWREAALRGIDVRGYEATDLERQELRRALEKKFGPNEISHDAPQRSAVDPERAPLSSSTRGEPSAAATRPSDDRQDKRAENLRDGIRAGVTLGVLLEHGAAPYKFNQDNGESYFVKVKTDRGEQTLWGVDLERAMAESKTRVQTGDLVGVENLGNRPVTVKVQKRDAQGQLVVEEIDTHRNTWSVEKKTFFQQQADKADAVRGSKPAQRADLAKQHPDLTDALVNLWLSEKFAKKSFARPEDQERAAAYAKERLAQMVERGEEISAPKLKREVAQLLDAHTAGEDKTTRHDDRTTKPPRARLPEAPQHVR